MLYLRNVRKQYHDTVVLAIQELTLEPGIYWIKGANGAGKTTLFKVLAGILPYQGHIAVNNGPELRQNPIRHRQLINYGEAEPLYPAFLTGQDLLELVAAAKKPAPTQAAELLDRLQMRNFIHSPIGSYSSGMLKKLSLLLAFLGNPAWIILDEPLITLDADAIQATNQLITEYHQTRGINFLLSSHQNFMSRAIPVTATLLLANQTLVPAGQHPLV